MASKTVSQTIYSTVLWAHCFFFLDVATRMVAKNKNDAKNEKIQRIRIVSMQYIVRSVLITSAPEYGLSVKTVSHYMRYVAPLYIGSLTSVPVITLHIPY